MCVGSVESEQRWRQTDGQTDRQLSSFGGRHPRINPANRACSILELREARDAILIILIGNALLSGGVSRRPCMDRACLTSWVKPEIL